MVKNYEPIALSPSQKLGGNMFIYYSMRMNRIIEVIGILRYIDFLKLEMDNTVSSFCERPLKLPIIQDGRRSSILMDTFVEYKDGVQEIRQINEYMSASTCVHLQRWCDDNAVKFTPVSNERLRREPKYFENQQSLYGCLTRTHINNEKPLLNLLKSYLSCKGGQATVGEIEQEDLFCSYRAMEVIALAYSYGEVSIVNMNTRTIDNNTGVSLCQPNQ